MNDATHKSVMLREAIEYLAPKRDEWVVDATFGSGGHTRALLATGTNVFAIDWDTTALDRGRSTFASEITQGRLILGHDTFARIDQLWQAQPSLQELQPTGILFDFGTSTEQLMSDERGFSFTGDGPLDMRMDVRRGVTAADLLVALSERELIEVFNEFGGEEESRRIAWRIKQSLPITTTSQLANLVAKVKRKPTRKLHPATKVFQALRIAVNTEMEEISESLPKALSLLADGGRLVTIGFHDGEDRIVKRLFREWAQAELGTIITKKPLAPSPEEIETNQRSRSAKLRVFEKAVQDKV